VGARFSAPVQTGSGAHPASHTMGTGSLPRVKRPGRGVDHPPPSSAEVKERVELYLYSPFGSLWPFLAVVTIRRMDALFSKPVGSACRGNKETLREIVTAAASVAANRTSLQSKMYDTPTSPHCTSFGCVQTLNEFAIFLIHYFKP
jgi:hypothetical protein